MKPSSWLAVLTLVALLPGIMGAAGGCSNLFTSLSNTKSDDALLFQAQMDANAKLWSDGITALNSMSATGLAQRSAQDLLASLYAGRCGLDFVALGNSLTNLSSNIFPFLMSYAGTSTVSQESDCETAESIILGISSTFSNLTADENVFLAFAEMQKIGRALANSGVGSSGAGTLNGSFVWTNDNTHYCATTTTASANVITDSEVAQVGTGLIIMMNALKAANLSVASSVVSEYDSLCSSTLVQTEDPTLCSKIYTSQYDSTSILLIRDLIRSSDIGFSECGGSLSSNAANCVCP
jgi:hypothetical protein